MKYLNSINLNNNKVTNLADGSAATDAVTLQQLQAYVNGLAWKAPVRVATTTNGTLASAYANGSTIDGVALTTGMRILIKDQTTATENGIYTVNASGAPTRSTDADTLAELQNATVYVIAGTVNADKSYTQTTNDITPGTTAQTWVQQNAGQTYTAGNGLSLTSGSFAVSPKAGGGITVDGTGVYIDSTYAALAKRYSANIGDGTATTIAVTHSLGTRDITWAVRDNTTFEYYGVDAVATDANTLTLSFASAPASASLRVTVHA